MKMAISFILLAALLCTCIPVYAAETTGFPEITVMSQVAGLDETAQSGWFDKSYNAVFCFNGRFFRVIAKVNETTVEKLNAILCAIRYDDPDSNTGRAGGHFRQDTLTARGGRLQVCW